VSLAAVLVSAVVVSFVVVAKSASDGPTEVLVFVVVVVVASSVVVWSTCSAEATICPHVPGALVAHNASEAIAMLHATRVLLRGAINVACPYS
jgi:hypothetical protein